MGAEAHKLMGLDPEPLGLWASVSMGPLPLAHEP